MICFNEYLLFNLNLLYPSGLKLSTRFFLAFLKDIKQAWLSFKLFLLPMNFVTDNMCLFECKLRSNKSYVSAPFDLDRFEHLLIFKWE